MRFSGNRVERFCYFFAFSHLISSVLEIISIFLFWYHPLCTFIIELFLLFTNLVLHSWTTSSILKFISTYTYSISEALLPLFDRLCYSIFSFYTFVLLDSCTFITSRTFNILLKSPTKLHFVSALKGLILL